MNANVTDEKPVLVINRGRRRKKTKADRRFSQEVRAEREPRCESCTRDFDREELVVHHIVEYAVSEALRRERGNVLVLCRPCHSRFSEAERFFSADRAAPYFTLPRSIRLRVLAFLRERAPEETTLMQTLNHSWDA